MADRCARMWSLLECSYVVLGSVVWGEMSGSVCLYI